MTSWRSYKGHCIWFESRKYFLRKNTSPNWNIKHIQCTKVESHLVLTIPWHCVKKFSITFLWTIISIRPSWSLRAILTSIIFPNTGLAKDCYLPNSDYSPLEILISMLFSKYISKLKKININFTNILNIHL